jgi:alpha-tubulin suppressor-like RCC1 family protein
VATCGGSVCGLECAPGSEAACRDRAVALGLGTLHSCAVLVDTTVRCWGNNSAGQVGDGSLTTLVSSPAVVQGVVGARAVVGGDRHSCALMSDGSVACWGSNVAGQLGTGTTAPSLTPVRVLDLEGAVALSAGAQHTCAVLGDDTVRCWGANNLGQLGSGTPGADGSAPLVVAALSGRPSQIVSTQTGSCVLLDGGEVECWGFIPSIDVGAPALLSSPQVVAARPQLLDVRNVVLLGAGWGSPSDRFCAAFSDGAVSCSIGAPVNNDAGTSMAPPVPGLEGKRAVGFGLGGFHTCMLDDVGGVSCWGSNLNGELGDATGTRSHVSAYSVPGLLGIVALATGGTHNCVIAGDGSVSCWGTNGNQELGTGDAAFSSAVPVRVQAW